MALTNLSNPTDAESLIKLHEQLLFQRAYPKNSRHLREVEAELKRLPRRLADLQKGEADLSPLDAPEVSGIAGTSVTSNFSYALVRWLVKKYPTRLSIDWDWFEEEDRFGAVMPRFLPLLEEEALVEAHVPYADWLRAARGRKNEVAWIIDRFAGLKLDEKAKAELYDSLKLHITWHFNQRSSRTQMRLPLRTIFYHDQPLIQRRDVSLVDELNAPPIAVEPISRNEGEKILDLARETSAVRYRELHGFTFGDPGRVIRAELGRGTTAYIVGVPWQNRLPLRAYHAAVIFKNGVPVAYFEGLSICERMESGFNLYYTFREGETAWLYARVLHLMRQQLGVTVFSIDPYQVGHENEEGIESGAFWFYRKLGFWPVQRELLRSTVAEERKLSTKKGYRTSPRMLRKLAAGHLLFDLNAASESQKKQRSAWDSFTVRRIGLAIQQRMARDFDSNPERFRAQAIDEVTRQLGIKTKDWQPNEIAALQNFSLLLKVIGKVDRWAPHDQQLASEIIRAKAGESEAHYLRLMQEHELLRLALIRLGSD